MVSVSEALNLVLQHLFIPSAASVPLHDAVGKVLRESVYADRDFPPFNRVAMDGIAIAFEKLQAGQREFVIEDVQPAGTPQKKLSDSTKAIEVMTGAVLPEGTDTVIRYEDITMLKGIAVISADGMRMGQHVHTQAQDARKGDELLKPGIILSPAEIALLASVGTAHVPVQQLPTIAIVSTGDELVDVTDMPQPHQLRRSNSYALHASLTQSGCISTLHHLPDEADAMERSLRSLLKQSDALILSGGVSKGKFDHVPGVLEKLGVDKIFHQVGQRPGKPFWFGVSQHGKAVFALPGNPVSTYVCFYKYVKPWLLKSLDVDTPGVHAVLGADFSFAPALTLFLQVHVKNEDGELVAYPLPGGGSGDFVNLREITGFLELPAEKKEFAKGEVYPYIPFRY